MEKLRADIVVIGAGPAGVTAAVTAARAGSSVVLISARAVLGGNSSSEIRVWTRGATGAGNLFSEEMGVWGDFKMRNLYTNLDGNPIFWDITLLDMVKAEKNITLLTNVYASDITMEDGKIKNVSAFQLDSERQLSIEGEMFIDCTGDGTIGEKAGIPYRVGKESSSEYGEDLAPENPSDDTQGNTLFYYVKELDHKVDFVPPAFAYDIDFIKEMVGRGGRIIEKDFGGSDYWWVEYGGQIDTIGDSQEIAFELKKIALGIWNYIKNSGEFEDVDNLTLEWMGSLPGKRESRRMITDYVLKQQDILERTDFYDTAFYGGWYMDFHPSEGFYASEDSCIQIPVNVYPIPLRTLYNSQVPNLLFAGRDIGTTHVAFSSTRIMNTCALAGQAAATLANYTINKKIDPKDVTKEDAHNIRQQLLRDDMFVLGYNNQDKDDLALNAEVKASSTFNGSLAPATGTMSVSKDSFISFPANPDVKSISLLVNAKNDTAISGDIYSVEVPSRNSYGELLGKVNVKIDKGISQWIDIPISVENETFVTFVIDNNPDLQVLTTDQNRTGIICGKKEFSVYYYPCVKLDLGGVYSPDNIINGYNRPYLQPNLWVSQPEENPWVSLSWEKEVKVSEVRIFFNPDLSKEIPSSKAPVWAESHKFTAREVMPPELVKGYKIYADGTLVHQENENWKRLAVIQLEKPVNAKELKIEVTDTYGSKQAEIFEVRVYSDYVLSSH